MKRISLEILKAMVETRFLLWMGIVAFTGTLSFGMVPLRGELADLRAETEGFKVRFLQAQEFASHQLYFDEVLKERSEVLSKLKGRTLEPGDQPRLISEIAQITRELGISILEMKPMALEPVTLKEIKGGPVVKTIHPVPFHLEILSGYEAAGLFFEKLRTSDLLLKIEEFEIEEFASNPGTLKTRLTLVAYELRDENPWPGNPA